MSRPLSPRRDRREQSLEVLYWLAVLKGKAQTLAEDTVVNTPTPSPRAISWSRRSGFRLEQRECEGKLRSYTLLAAETLIIVNHMVRLAGLRFSPGPGGPADRQLRSAREARLSIILANRRITRSRRAAVILEVSIHMQKCVLESVNMAIFSSPPAGPLAAGLESDFCRCRLEVLHLFQNFTRGRWPACRMRVWVCERAVAPCSRV